MTIRRILTYPDKFLRQLTKPVENIDGQVQQIVDDMAATMYDAPGAGLAACQIGCDKQILVYDDLPGEDRASLQVLVNPKIIEKEGLYVSEDEGCLSVPDFRATVKRAQRVLVEAVDRHGNPLRIEADGYLAVVLQHEIDHLNGTLFIDRISSLKRELYKKRIHKRIKPT